MEPTSNHLTAYVSNYRHKKILEILYQRETVRNDELAAEFCVSKITIRRDLKVLANDNYLVRTRGGAIPFCCARIISISLARRSGLA